MFKLIFFIFAIFLIAGTFAKPAKLTKDDIEIKFVYEGPDKGGPIKMDEDFLQQLSDKIKNQIIATKNNE